MPRATSIAWPRCTQQGPAPDVVGVRRQVIGRWVQAHRAGGDQALAARRRVGHTKLIVAQRRWIVGLVAGKDPDQFSLPGTSGAICTPCSATAPS